MRKVTFILLGLMVPVLLSGVEDRGPTDSLRMEDWIQSALPRHPDLNEAQTELVYRMARVSSPGTWDDPELRISRDNRQDRTNETEIRLRIPLPNPWEASARHSELNAMEAAARSGWLIAVVSAQTELKELFAEAVDLQTRLNLQNDLVRRCQPEMQQASKLKEAGLLSSGDFLRLRMELAEIRIEQVKLSAAFERILKSLEEAGAVRIERISTVDQSILEPIEPIAFEDLDTLIRNALDDSPFIAGIHADRAIRAAQARSLSAERIPWFDYIQGSWTHEEERDRDDWMVGVQVELPIFSFFRGRALANALEERAGNMEAIQRELIVSSIRQAYAKLLMARSIEGGLSRIIGRLPEETERFLESSPQNDPIGRMRHLKNLHKQRLELIQARNDRLVASIELEGIYGLNQPLRVLVPPAFIPKHE